MRSLQSFLAVVLLALTVKLMHAGEVPPNQTTENASSSLPPSTDPAAANLPASPKLVPNNHGNAQDLNQRQQLIRQLVDDLVAINNNEEEHDKIAVGGSLRQQAGGLYANWTEGMHRETALTFIFALFWGAMISSMRTHKIFHVWWGTGAQASARLVVGVSVLNFYPLIIFIVLYFAESIVPKEPLWCIICAAIGSLSVFSAVFLLPGILQTPIGGRRLGDRLYNTGAQQHWREQAKEDKVPSDNCARSYFATLAYLVIPPVIAAIVGNYVAQVVDSNLLRSATFLLLLVAVIGFVVTVAMPEKGAIC